MSRKGIQLNSVGGDFPGGPVVGNPSCGAGNVGSVPGWGTKIPHAAEQLSPHPTTTEPACSRACMLQLESMLHNNSKSDKKDPASCKEDPRAMAKSPHSLINKYINK